MAETKSINFIYSHNELPTGKESKSESLFGMTSNHFRGLALLESLVLEGLQKIMSLWN